MKKYSETHEWVELQPDGTALMGISDHAQTLLGDIAFLELPAVGSVFHKNGAIGVVESVKSASDFYAPLSGTVLAVNDAAIQDPASLNHQAETTWLLKLQVHQPGEWDALVSAAEYQSRLKNNP